MEEKALEAGGPVKQYIHTFPKEYIKVREVTFVLRKDVLSDAVTEHAGKIAAIQHDAFLDITKIEEEGQFFKITADLKREKKH